jgi:hypothetical protein
MTMCASGCQHGLRCHFLMHAFQWLPHELELTLRTRVVEPYTLPVSKIAQMVLSTTPIMQKWRANLTSSLTGVGDSDDGASPACVAYLFRPVHKQRSYFSRNRNRGVVTSNHDNEAQRGSDSVFYSLIGALQPHSSLTALFLRVSAHAPQLSLYSSDHTRLSRPYIRSCLCFFITTQKLVRTNLLVHAI